MIRGAKVVLVVAVIAALAFSSMPASAQTIAGKEIRIGVLLPITGMGANVGKREAIGAKAAIDVINAEGGVNGVPLKMVFEDTASNPQEGVNAFRKLVSDQKVLAVVGPHYSSVAEATFPLGNMLKVVQISVASSKPGLSAANRPYAFRNTLTEDKLAGVVVKEFKKYYNIKKVAIMTDIKDSVSKSVGTDVLPAAFKTSGIEIITGNSPITFQTNDAQFTAQITKLKALNPDGVGLGALGPDALNIITEARRQGFNKPFVSTSQVMEGEVPQKGGKAVEGTFSGNVWDRSDNSPASQKFKAAYAKAQKTLYPEDFTKNPDYYTVAAYESVLMIVDAIKKMGVTNKPEDLAADRAKIMTYLSGLHNFNGIASKGFDRDGDGIKTVRVFMIKNSQWVRVDK